MCDPVSLSIAGTVIGGLGSAANAMGAMSAQRKQKQEVQNWVRQQNANRAAEKVRQDAMRQRAEQAQQQGLDQVAAENQKKVQSQEQGRLANYIEGGADPNSNAPAPPVSAADKAIAANTAASTASDPIKSDLARKINEATTSAKQRLAALATASSYGGSSGGLGTVMPLALNRAGAGIDLQNNFRRGSLSAYNTEQNVEPVQVSYTGSPLAQVFGDIFSAGASALGGAAGKSVFGTFPKAPTTGNSFIGPAKPLPAYLATTDGLF